MSEARAGRVGAVVLCGGESSRMGRPKAWLPFGPEPMLARVVRRLAEVASPIVVVAAPDQDLPDLPPDVTIARDAVAGRGPLEGLLAGLDALLERAATEVRSPRPVNAFTGRGKRESLEFPSIYISATDAPFVSGALVRRLEVLRAEDDHDAAVPQIDGRVHPLAAILRASARSKIAERLGRGDLRLRSLFDDLRTRFVTRDDLLADPDLRRADPDLRCLRNLNMPDDYTTALAEEALSRRD